MTTAPVLLGLDEEIHPAKVEHRLKTRLFLFIVPNIKRFHGFSCSNLLRHLLQSPFASHLHCEIGRNHIQNPPSMLAVNEKGKSAPS